MPRFVTSTTVCISYITYIMYNMYCILYILYLYNICNEYSICYIFNICKDYYVRNMHYIYIYIVPVFSQSLLHANKYWMSEPFVYFSPLTISLFDERAPAMSVQHWPCYITVLWRQILLYTSLCRYKYINYLYTI